MSKENNRVKKRIYIILTVLVFTSMLTGMIIFSQDTLPARASLESNLRVYWPNGSFVEYVDWGIFSPGFSRHLEFIVENHEEHPVTLKVDTADWSPQDASEYFNLDCNPNNLDIAPGDTIEIELILTASESENDIMDFRFTTIITGVKCDGLSGFCSIFQERRSTVIYPSESENKPLQRSPAMVSDWTASAFISTKLDDYNEGLDSDDVFIESTGYPATERDTSIITFGGPIVNVPVYHYEEQGLAPVVHDVVPGARGPGEPWSQWYLNDGSSIIETAKEPDDKSDLFLIEIFQDEEGRDVLIAYGITWKGTYAAGKYFESTVYPNLQDFPYEWIIVQWTDTNNDGFVNEADDGDTYTILATN